MMGRPILQKQVGYTLFRPAAYSLGGLVADMPFGAFQIMIFSMIVYLFVLSFLLFFCGLVNLLLT
jgi:ATP-binding cassette, subfamily G (WHITE), member 2, PDR